MKISPSWFIRYIIIALVFTCTSLQADPPSRVARLNNIEGNVSFLPAGSDEWLDAVRNRPFITGDRLWNDTNGFSQLQLGGAKLCIGPNTNINVLNLDNNIAQFQLTEGSLNLEVNSLKNKQTYEIDTPNVAFSVQKPGTYRVDVDKSGDATIVQIAKGQGEVYGDNSSYIINNNQAYRFTGTDLNYDANFQGLPQNELDQWCNKNKNTPRATTTRYVSQDVIGYEDLESAGTWEEVAEYGQAWSPNNVDPDWAPYSNGHWAWIEPWGWNWIGQEDWGFAPYHYGRWVHHNKWYWLPYGDEGAVYAPALVAFIGAVAGYGLASHWGNNVAWFPLGPGDIYRPPYAVSYQYFTHINRGDRINQRLLRQAYQNPNMHFKYHNRNARNAITAVPRNAFQSQNINKARIRVNANQLDKLPATSNLTLKPQRGNVNGADRASRFKPSESALSRQAITKARVPSQNKNVVAPTIREVKPSKPRDIGNQLNREKRDLNNPRNNQIAPKPQDKRFNQPLPKRQQVPKQNDSSVPERFRQTMPEYDPSGGGQLRSQHPRVNQGANPDLRRQQRLERQQPQVQPENRRPQAQPFIREQRQPQVQPRIRERNQSIQRQPQVRQQIPQRAQPQNREHIQQRVRPQMHQQIQRQAPPAAPPVQRIQRPAAPPPQAAPPAAPGQPDQNRRGRH